VAADAGRCVSLIGTAARRHRYRRLRQGTACLPAGSPDSGWPDSGPCSGHCPIVGVSTNSVGQCRFGSQWGAVGDRNPSTTMGRTGTGAVVTLAGPTTPAGHQHHDDHRSLPSPELLPDLPSGTKGHRRCVRRLHTVPRPALSGPALRIGNHRERSGKNFAPYGAGRSGNGRAPVKAGRTRAMMGVRCGNWRNECSPSD